MVGRMVGNGKPFEMRFACEYLFFLSDPLASFSLRMCTRTVDVGLEGDGGVDAGRYTRMSRRR